MQMFLTWGVARNQVGNVFSCMGESTSSRPYYTFFFIIFCLSFPRSRIWKRIFTARSESFVVALLVCQRLSFSLPNRISQLLPESFQSKRWKLSIEPLVRFEIETKQAGRWRKTIFLQVALEMWKKIARDLLGGIFRTSSLWVTMVNSEKQLDKVNLREFFPCFGVESSWS